jgi:hypothetical protein
MNHFTLSFLQTILIGLGATITFDLWGLFLKYAFKIAPSNICLVGRWLRYMPEGIFKHANIGSSPPKRAECAVGWMAHYTIGITFSIVFVAIVGNNWFQQPTLIPAMLFGVVTVFAPFFIMQPSLWVGVCCSKNGKSRAGKISQFDESHSFWCRALRFRIVG